MFVLKQGKKSSKPAKETKQKDKGNPSPKDRENLTINEMILYDMLFYDD